jgi:fermentation-respiration switch protein FrsA (DUF1100 family)
VRLINPIPGALVLALDYPMASRLPDENVLSKIGSVPGLIAGSAEMLSTVSLAWRYLESDPRIEHVALVGVSLGIPFITAVAAECGEPDAVALLYGGGEVWKIVARALPVRPGVVQSNLGRLLGRLISRLDPARHVGRISPAPLLLVHATDDPRIPKECIAALNEAAREPKTIVAFEGGHVLPEKKEVVALLVAEASDWLRELQILQPVAGDDARESPPPVRPE